MHYFCRLALILKEAVDFPNLFLDRPRNLVPLVFEVCMVDVDALLEHAAFLFFLYTGIPLSALPTFWGRSLEGLQRMLFQPCSDRDSDFCGGIELVLI